MIDEIKIKEVIKADTNPIVENGELHLVVEYYMDRIIEIGLGKSKL